jgi:hypothetical protein
MLRWVRDGAHQFGWRFKWKPWPSSDFGGLYLYPQAEVPGSTKRQQLCILRCTPIDGAFFSLEIEMKQAFTFLAKKGIFTSLAE